MNYYEIRPRIENKINKKKKQRKYNQMISLFFLVCFLAKLVLITKYVRIFFFLKYL